MGFITYSQNFEDVMLWRALNNIENGFYIDVGAMSPDFDSVTKAFYDRGWRGINIEPNPEYFKLFPEQRSDDINLQLAIADKITQTQIYLTSNPGLSTLDESIALEHSKKDGVIKPVLVSVTTLSEVCKKYASGKKNIHFLKIDVEGFEKSVIVGNDWVKYRPWVVLVEASRPMTQTENYEEWEPFLISQDYVFVYADGVNRFYLSKEHIGLKKAFKYPPNFFDYAIPSMQIHAEVDAKIAKNQLIELTQRFDLMSDQLESCKKEIDQLESEVNFFKNNVGLAEKKLLKKQKEIDELNNELMILYKSLSWRITRPFRWLQSHFNSIKENKKK